MAPQTKQTAVVLAGTAVEASPLVKALSDLNPCPACGSTDTAAGFWTFECLNPACGHYEAVTNDDMTDRSLRGDC